MRTTRTHTAQGGGTGTVGSEEARLGRSGYGRLACWGVQPVPLMLRVSALLKAGQSRHLKLERGIEVVDAPSPLAHGRGNAALTSTTKRSFNSTACVRCD